MIRFHCALPAEAAPLNNYFNLSLLEEGVGYRLFGKGELQLLLSGPGGERVRSAIEGFDHHRWGEAIWYNVGIAGSAEFDYGQGVPIGEVSCEGGEFVSIDSLQGGASVITHSAPTREYPPRGLVDMELWHLSQALGSRRLFSLKVVSDTPDIDFVAGKKELKSLIRGSLAKIEKTLKKISS